MLTRMVDIQKKNIFMICRVWKRAYIGRWLRLGFETSTWSFGLSLSQNHPNLRPNVLLHEISTRANTDRIRIQIQIIGIISDVVFTILSLNKSHNLFQHTFQSTYIKKSKSHRANINWSVLWCNGKTPSRLDWRRIYECTLCMARQEPSGAVWKVHQSALGYDCSVCSAIGQVCNRALCAQICNWEDLLIRDSFPHCPI